MATTEKINLTVFLYHGQVVDVDLNEKQQQQQQQTTTTTATTMMEMVEQYCRTRKTTGYYKIQNKLCGQCWIIKWTCCHLIFVIWSVENKNKSAMYKLE